MHGHQDMEIVTYVLEGELEHRDNLGTGSVIHAGEFQRMSAGTGVQHGEFNPSETEPVHLYQIWLLPAEKGLTPSYEQKTFSNDDRKGRLRLVASPDAQDGSLLIHQDARIYLSSLDANQEIRHKLAAGRHAWLQVLRGSVELNGHKLATSDGAAVSDETALSIRADKPPKSCSLIYCRKERPCDTSLLRHGGPYRLRWPLIASSGDGHGLPVPRLAEDPEPDGLDGPEATVPAMFQALAATAEFGGAWL